MPSRMIRAWQNIDRFQGRSSFSTWMTRIVINEGLRKVKRNETALALVLDDVVGERVPGWGDRPDELFESREFLAAVDSALAGCRSSTARRSCCETSRG